MNENMTVREAYDSLTPDAQRIIHILVGGCLAQIEHVVRSMALSDGHKILVIDGLLHRTMDAAKGEWDG